MERQSAAAGLGTSVRSAGLGTSVRSEGPRLPLLQKCSVLNLGYKSSSKWSVHGFSTGTFVTRISSFTRQETESQKRAAGLGTSVRSVGLGTSVRSVGLRLPLLHLHHTLDLRYNSLKKWSVPVFSTGTFCARIACVRTACARSALANLTTQSQQNVVTHFVMIALLNGKETNALPAESHLVPYAVHPYNQCCCLNWREAS
jgi:hypothetical protein